MSQRKRTPPRSPAEAQAYDSASHAMASLIQEQSVKPALHEALEIVQHARELEARRGRTNALPEGAFALQRLLIALLETLTPEQRAEVRRRLGQ
jgi:hypothetical protein